MRSEPEPKQVSVIFFFASFRIHLRVCSTGQMQPDMVIITKFIGRWSGSRNDVLEKGIALITLTARAHIAKAGFQCLDAAGANVRAFHVLGKQDGSSCPALPILADWKT